MIKLTREVGFARDFCEISQKNVKKIFTDSFLRVIATIYKCFFPHFPVQDMFIRICSLT
jgi:hypothetical protein